jgi:UDP-N-acetyl-D-mannosaminuronic acid dehydrogenase
MTNSSKKIHIITNDNGKAKKILIIGLGQIGRSNAEYMTSLGLDVDGYDISEQSIDRALKDGIIKNTCNSFSGYDYYIICISTHNPDDMFMPFQDGIIQIAHKIAKEGKSGALVGIDSTISRGTSKMVLNILEHKLHVCHVPHRFYIHDKEEHGVRQIRAAGACNECCMKQAKYFYNYILKIPLYEVSSVEVAELCKIVENSHRFLEIAFAEELKIMCDNSGLDFDELRNAVNTKWNTKILEARGGIGGHCLPKDSQMFMNTSKAAVGLSIIEAAKEVDQKYRMHMAKMMLGKAVQIEPRLQK